MNPYESLPARAFWRTAVADQALLAIGDLWRPKFPVAPSDPVATAGSCFAQHIGRALVERGHAWFDGEPAPSDLQPKERRDFNYGVFSFRTGNVYTVALLRQWFDWAFAVRPPSDEVWRENGRCFDPFRPAVEPNGFASEQELFASRATTLAAIRRVVQEAKLFVFTLGLTEAWVERRSGFTYPNCPGTVAGTFDAAAHSFHNSTFNEVLGDLKYVVAMATSINPALRFLLTVSPVPLTATASGEHVLVATTHSKSVLRAVAGEVANGSPAVDYFPSYEVVTAFPFRGVFFEPNLRNVSPDGVRFVMSHFFAGLNGTSAGAPADESRPDVARVVRPQSPQEIADDVVCEEALLEGWNRAR